MGSAMVYSLHCSLKELVTSLALRLFPNNPADEEDQDGELSVSVGLDGKLSIEDGMKKVKGVTPVNRDSFTSWWARFKAEQDLKKQEKIIQALQALGDAPVPLTGRQIFEKNLANDKDDVIDLDPSEEDDSLFFEFSSASLSASSSTSSSDPA